MGWLIVLPQVALALDCMYARARECVCLCVCVKRAFDMLMNKVKVVISKSVVMNLLLVSKQAGDRRVQFIRYKLQMYPSNLTTSFTLVTKNLYILVIRVHIY